MLHSQTHTRSKCALSLGTQMRAQHTYKVELIGWKWIRIFELKFNYTSNTWIHFPLNKIRVLQIKKSLLNSRPPLDPSPSPEVALLGFCCSSKMFSNAHWNTSSVLFSCVCLHRHDVYKLEVLLSASAPCGTPGVADVLCRSVPCSWRLAALGLHMFDLLVSYWLTIKMFPVSFH